MMKTTLVGIGPARAKLGRLSNALAGATLLRAVIAGALIVQGDAKRRAPFKTGNLRRSIHIEPQGASRVYAAVDVGTDVEYAVHQEFGTRYIGAHPFLRPALDENVGRIQAAIAAALRMQIAAIAGGV